MKSIQLYFKGIIFSAETLISGKFLIFFLPGFIVMLAYLFTNYEVGVYTEAAQSTKDIWLIGGVFSWMLEGFGELLSWIIEQLYIFIVLVLFSPFNSVLSEKYDTHITGNKFEGGFIRILNDLLRALFIVVMSLIMELLCVAGYWVLTIFIPDSLETVLSPVMYFLIPSFFIGFAFFDYSLERYGVGTISSWGYSFKRMLSMLIGGSLFMLFYNIPYVGIILAPVILTLLTTYVYVHREGKIALATEDDELLDQTV